MCSGARKKVSVCSGHLTSWPSDQLFFDLLTKRVFPFFMTFSPDVKVRRCEILQREKKNKKNWKFFENVLKFLAKVLLCFGAKTKSKSNFSGGGGRLSVRAVQKHAYFLVSRHMAFCQAEFWAGLKSGALGRTRPQKSARIFSGADFPTLKHVCSGP